MTKSHSTVDALILSEAEQLEKDSSATREMIQKLGRKIEYHLPRHFLDKICDTIPELKLDRTNLLRSKLVDKIKEVMSPNVTHSEIYSALTTRAYIEFFLKLVILPVATMAIIKYSVIPMAIAAPLMYFSPNFRSNFLPLILPAFALPGGSFGLSAFSLSITVVMKSVSEYFTPLVFKLLKKMFPKIKIPKEESQAQDPKLVSVPNNSILPTLIKNTEDFGKLLSQIGLRIPLKMLLPTKRKTKQLSEKLNLLKRALKEEFVRTIKITVGETQTHTFAGFYFSEEERKIELINKYIQRKLENPGLYAWHFSCIHEIQSLGKAEGSEDMRNQFIDEVYNAIYKSEQLPAAESAPLLSGMSTAVPTRPAA